MLVGAVPAAADTPNRHQAAGVAAGKWLVTKLVDDRYPGFAGPDWGLTIDALMALKATRADDAAAAAIADAIHADGAGYYTYKSGDLQAWTAGATAKTLVAAVTAGRDHTTFTGRDMRQATLDLVAKDGPYVGQVQSKNKNGKPGPTTDANTFDQALAVIGLARTGGVPKPVVDYLVKQQCPAGGFRLGGFDEGKESCISDTAIDNDATAMAVLALQEAGATEAAEKGVRNLLDQQAADGSLKGKAPEVPNTNSTGLAGLALTLAGKTAEGDRAADWVLGNQLVAANAGPLSGELGAIGWNQEGIENGKAGAENGKLTIGVDQFIRAGSQAVLALAKVPLGKEGSLPPSGEPETTPPTTTTTVTSTVPPVAAAGAGGQGSAPNGPLANTGVPTLPAVLVGTGLIGAGIALTYLARRRETS
ncbi:prenyltransferase/squalene oxidase repeat-containing protein [Amycolatopsis suaedae]|uniref:Cell wall anchor protein n=1 Tax=Amycolatopsis suaedae TaxID=2510978 RepID=A0A4Q7JD30_9PSEU|nr:prenyltransferase/squalene oxidase repeat-containing protein [Amycolatopsis suaedae]RZQ65299.1 cell wall anchor protein [Amycolatopsis suaedae]